MATIDNLTKEFISAYTVANKDEMHRLSKSIIREIKRDTYQFKKVEHPYIVAKALYYIWNSDCADTISDSDGCDIIKLSYYCIIKHYIDNCESVSSMTKYLDLISACELGVVLILENAEFIMYSVLSGELNYLPNFSQKHIRNQILLWGGTVKEAHRVHCNVSMDESISQRCQTMMTDIDSQLPIGDSLQNFRNITIEVIREICKGLELNFDIKDDEDFYFM